MNYQFIKNMVGETPERNLLNESKALIQKWGKTGLLKKLAGKKASNMAIMLDSEAKALKALNESTSVGDIAGFNKIAFPLVRRVFAQLIANEIVSVQPMSLPSGLLFYLDFQYERNKSGFTAGGSVYGNKSSVVNQQLEGVGSQTTLGGFFNLQSGYSTRIYRFTTSACTFSGVTITANGGQAIGQGSGAVNPLTYLGGTLSGFDFVNPASAVMDVAQLMNIRVALSGQLNYGANTFRTYTPIESLTSETVTQYIDPAFTSQLANGKIRIFSNIDMLNSSDGGVAGADGAAVRAPLVCSASAGKGMFVVYGPLKTDLQDNPKGTNLGDFEGVTGIPEINLAISSVPVMAETRKLKTKWTPELAQDLNAYHALDAEVELTTILSELIALEIDREILGALLEGASCRAAWSRKIGKYVSLSADNITLTTGSFVGASNATYQSFFGTQNEWYQTLGEVINVVSNMIHKRSLRHGANFIVTSPEVSSIIESINGYKPTIVQDASEVQYSLGLEKSGALQQKYAVYKDPYFPANWALMGFKGGSFLETGFVYAPYVPLLVTQTIFAPEDFTPRKGVMTRYAKQMVRPEMYGTIQVLDLDWVGGFTRM